mmetsp:Transcript_15337/g.42048  ORF Transcript_15337/g.42048 Transcript_15337/m.42048 type:complete len:242 (-) Transcript_15337:14-739(-)|eukprot:CAMPEP_0117494362 /NCGR_PEP_ID=MMETSP0784-20121206/19573_1 /TAXON_ID=39447 /ORGANISM="" /LENGTH=241 /DNA_ID=CAMNT_0005289241 /DNA_START=55 /DNA_END=780 /DNA_ORIENTATION=+
MYCLDDERENLALASLRRDAGTAEEVLPRTSSDDVLRSCGAMSQVSDANTADAISRALVAREQRRAAVGVAECLVRIKELDALAEVETTRLTQQGATERQRVEEEQKSQRVERLAKVLDLSIKEQAHTVRASVATMEQTKREAIAVHERLETTRIKASEWNFGLASHIFVAALAATLAGGRRRASSSRFLRFAWLVALIMLGLWWSKMLRAGRVVRGVWAMIQWSSKRDPECPASSKKSKG